MGAVSPASRWYGRPGHEAAASRPHREAGALGTECRACTPRAQWRLA